MAEALVIIVEEGKNQQLIFLLMWMMVKGKNENEGTSKEARSLRRVIVTSAGFCQPQP